MENLETTLAELAQALDALKAEDPAKYAAIEAEIVGHIEAITAALEAAS